MCAKALARQCCELLDPLHTAFAVYGVCVGIGWLSTQHIKFSLILRTLANSESYHNQTKKHKIFLCATALARQCYKLLGRRVKTVDNCFCEAETAQSEELKERAGE